MLAHVVFHLERLGRSHSADFTDQDLISATGPKIDREIALNHIVRPFVLCNIRAIGDTCFLHLMIHKSLELLPRK